MPAEWAEQEWLWIGFPHDRLAVARRLVPRARSRSPRSPTRSPRPGSRCGWWCATRRTKCARASWSAEASSASGTSYGDIWLRDTGPLVVFDGAGRRLARRFGFNGWGGKYQMAGDESGRATMAEAAGPTRTAMDWILEGGAIDTDGTGLVVTTEQCLLNPNRNPRLSKADIEARLRDDLGFDRVLWLGDGLLGDHTDGHVDNLARFVAPGDAGDPAAERADDPNAAVYADARARGAGVRARGARRPVAAGGWTRRGSSSRRAT
jgi:agmatine deiminase